MGAPAMVLVTHHVEEIPPGFTHALLLKQGRIVAAGPIDEALTAETLSDTFDLALTLNQQRRPLHRPRPLIPVPLIHLPAGSAVRTWLRRRGTRPAR